MIASFDSAATSYDQNFTNSIIGKLQRRYVYRHLSQVLEELHPKTILEVNCGTGEDAIWLAQQNFEVIATDISSKMIAIARSKRAFPNLHFEALDINSLSEYFSGQQFDLIFSNFGGLNCLSETEMESFFKNTSELLSKNGQLTLVIMPRNTIWEQFYYLSKADFANAFRRKKKHVISNVDGEKIRTFYYNPSEIIGLAKSYFNLKRIRPIGFFVPPSYLGSFLQNKPRFTSLLNNLELKATEHSKLSKYSDHYLIVFQKR